MEIKEEQKEIDEATGRVWQVAEWIAGIIIALSVALAGWALTRTEANGREISALQTTAVRNREDIVTLQTAVKDLQHGINDLPDRLVKKLDERGK